MPHADRARQCRPLRRERRAPAAFPADLAETGRRRPRVRPGQAAELRGLLDALQRDDGRPSTSWWRQNLIHSRARRRPRGANQRLVLRARLDRGDAAPDAAAQSAAVLAPAPPAAGPRRPAGHHGFARPGAGTAREPLAEACQRAHDLQPVRVRSAAPPRRCGRRAAAGRTLPAARRPRREPEAHRRAARCAAPGAQRAAARDAHQSSGQGAPPRPPPRGRIAGAAGARSARTRIRGWRTPNWSCCPRISRAFRWC